MRWHGGHHSTWTIAVATCASICFTGVAQVPCAFSAELPPTVPCQWPYSPSWQVPSGINSSGTWVGYRWKCPPYDAYTFPILAIGGGPSQVLPTPDGTLGAEASAINDNGIIVGTFSTSLHDDWACIWDGPSFLVIPPAPGGDRSYATAINNAGVVAGYRFSDSSHFPFVWANGIVTDIDPSPFDAGIAWGISDTGYVAGTLGIPLNGGRAFRWHDGETVVLDPLPGATTAVGIGVNSLGWIVGASGFPTGQPFHYVFQVTLWKDTAPIGLPTLPGYTNAAARSVSDTGVVVGGCYGGPLNTAVIWVDGGVYSLGSLTPGLPGTSDLALQVTSSTLILADNSSAGACVFTPSSGEPADLNGDCRVDGVDLGILLSNWGTVAGPGDCNGDGKVDGMDLGIVLGAWSPSW